MNLDEKLKQRMQNFIDKGNAKYENKFDYSKVHLTYKNSDILVTIICPIHGEFEQTPTSHLGSRTGCKQCGINARTNPPQETASSFIERAVKKHGDKYDYSHIKELNSPQDQIELTCPVHGKFKIKAYRHIESDYGCQKCGRASINANSKKTTDEFIQECINLYGSKYTYKKVNYVNAMTNVIITCQKHGDFEKTPNNFLSGQKCNECSKEKFTHPSKIQFADYKLKCDTKFNSKYTYNEESFVNMDSHIAITCPEHDTFEMRAFDHLNSETGCTKCGRLLNDQRRTKTTAHFIQKARLKHGDKYDYSKANYINDQTNVIINCPIHGDFEQTPNNHTSVTGCPKCSKINTITENELLDLIPNSIQNDRKLINPYEIDILSHEYKFGIEYNGLLWHSFGINYPNNIEEYSQKKYQHLNKTKLVEEKEYQLFHIFENEWLNSTQKEIWKSMLNNKIGKSNKIFARKCKIIELNNDEYREFIKSNHIQGYRGAVHKYGLLYENELVACMSFSKPTKGKYDYELIRFCNKLNCNVIGGASKLLKYFESNIDAKVIVSYANRRWSQGHLYDKLGFEFIENSEPNYYYLDNNCKVHSRRNFQKHMLKDKLSDFDESLTEFENMINHNFRIIHDSGNKVYVKNKNKKDIKMLIQSKSDYDIAVGYEFPNSKKLYVDFSFTINTDHRPGDSFDKSSVTIKSISINNLESTTHMNMSINELSKLFTNTFDKFSDTITGKSIAILKVDVEKCPEILKEVNFNE